MQKTIKALALGLLALSAHHLTAFTGKTFLADRPKGVDSLLERVTLQSMNASKAEDSFGATFQATAFYNESLKSDDIAKYFFFNDKTGAAFTRDQLRLFIPDNVPGAQLTNAADTSLKINPTIRTYGLMLTYYQDLEKILPGLYFNVRAPIVEVDTDLGAIATGGNATVLNQFLNGTLPEILPNAVDARKPLQSARYTGKGSAIGIADIDLRMGYAFLQHEHGSLGLNIGLTIPTGNHPEGKSVLEAIYGNCGHWGFGLGVEGRYQLWSGDDAMLDIHANSDYRQLFTNTERRTFALKGVNLLDQYRIVAAPVAVTAPFSSNVQALPAANVLTMNTDVTPGMQLDNAVGFTYTYGGLTFDLGYNLYYRNQESLKLRDAWNDNQPSYVYLTDAVNPAFPAVPLAADIIFGGNALVGANVPDLTAVDPAPARYAPLLSSNIDFNAPRTPVQLTNKILAGVGYVFKEWEYPIMLGVGGHYEIPSDNGSIRTWGFYFKTGVAF